MARFLNVATFRPETVTVALAGTAVSPASRNVPEGAEVVILAHPSNTDRIKIADTAANAQAAIGVNNVPLSANQSISLQIIDPANLFIDAVVAGERAIVFYEF